jgi:ribosomal protein L40E
MDHLPDPVLCPGCGAQNGTSSRFCRKCGAPLAWQATVDPVASIFAEGYAARQAASKPQSLLVVIGVWLWFLPIGLFGVIGIITSVVYFVMGLLSLDLFVIAPTPLGLLVSVVFVYISLRMLYKTTSNYLRGQVSEQPSLTASRNGQRHVLGQEGDEHAPETVACLACGHALQKEAATCPACGWSYRAGM